jgi:8-oxo-dGTP pyrophosphatase MutT (NUDIX family)
MTKEAAPARPASTVLLLRDAPARGAVETFMMVRHIQIEFQSGALVFPGGSVDPGDRDIAERPDLHTAFGDDAAALDFRVAALRETFEESGILLARPRGSDDLISASRAAEVEAEHRVALCEGKVSFAEIIARNELVLALDQLVPYAHWITPVVAPKRFDTWFFLAAAPPEQLGRHDGKESTDSIWLPPQEALDGSVSGRFKLPFPTTRNLIRLGKQPNVAAALDDARARTIVTVLPEVTKLGDRRRLRIPREADYDGEEFEVAS